MAAPVSRSQRKQRHAQLRPDLMALRLESLPMPNTIAELVEVVEQRWPAGSDGLPKGWGWVQVKAYQRLHQLLQAGRGDG